MELLSVNKRLNIIADRKPENNASTIECNSLSLTLIKVKNDIDNAINTRTARANTPKDTDRRQELVSYPGSTVKTDIP